jgi:hypothetical protein
VDAGEKGGVQSRQGNEAAAPVVGVGVEPPRQPSAEVPTSIAAADVESPPTPKPDQDQGQRRTRGEMKASIAQLQRERAENMKEIFALHHQLLSSLLNDVRETNWGRKDRTDLWRLAGELQVVAFDIECALACGLND